MPEEALEQLVIKGGPEALRPYVGQVVAVDEDGVVREAADSWEGLHSKLTDDVLSKVSLLYVPDARVIG